MRRFTPVAIAVCLFVGASPLPLLAQGEESTPCEDACYEKEQACYEKCEDASDEEACEDACQDAGIDCLEACED